MDAATDELKQYSLADRALNPSAQDICRLFQMWREKSYGADDGKPLFERLQSEVNKYNEKYGGQNGKANLQWYESHTHKQYHQECIRESTQLHTAVWHTRCA